MHILLVEDDGNLSSLFHAQLRRLGKEYTLTAAATKAQALRAFQDEMFDCIFIDMALEGIPDMGLKILKEIRSVSATQRAGVLSSNDAKDMVKFSQEAGADFYMVKPFTFRGLTLILEGDSEAIRRYQPDLSEGRIIAFK